MTERFSHSIMPDPTGLPHVPRATKLAVTHRWNVSALAALTHPVTLVDLGSSESPDVLGARLVRYCESQIRPELFPRGAPTFGYTVRRIGTVLELTVKCTFARGCPVGQKLIGDAGGRVASALTTAVLVARME